MSYQPYRDNTQSVKRWLTSHMAIQYNWQMIIRCLVVLIPTSLLFGIYFPWLTQGQNLVFRSGLFLSAILIIWRLSYINRPRFVTTPELYKYTKGKMTVPLWGDAVEWLYFMLNFDNEDIAKKQARSNMTPIELLQDMNNQQLAEATYSQIEQEGGLKPRSSEPICIAVICILVVSQWFFVHCGVTKDGALVYEPAWLARFLDWFMGNHMAFPPLVDRFRMWTGIDLERTLYLDDIQTLQDAVHFPLFRSSFVYHIFSYTSMWMIQICAFSLLYYRKGLLAYDRVAPSYASNGKLVRYTYVFFLAFGCFGFIISFIGIDFYSLPSVESNSPIPTYTFEFFFTFFNLLTAYIFTDFILDIKLRFFPDRY